jgi:hypothetical protein
MTYRPADLTWNAGERLAKYINNAKYNHAALNDQCIYFVLRKGGKQIELIALIPFWAISGGIPWSVCV